MPKVVRLGHVGLEDGKCCCQCSLGIRAFTETKYFTEDLSFWDNSHICIIIYKIYESFQYKKTFIN